MTGKICGTGSWAPLKVWDNNDLARMVDTSDEWIRERTGVVQRHIAEENEDTVTMASRAAQRALEDADIKAEEIDLIIVATISPTEIMPCVACGVQEKLGAEKATCFDLNGACTGSLLALNTAQAYLSQGIYQTALVIGAEKLYRFNGLDRSRHLHPFWGWSRSSCTESRRKRQICPGNTVHRKKRRCTYTAKQKPDPIRNRSQSKRNLHTNEWKRSFYLRSFESSGGSKKSSFQRKSSM